MESVGPIRILLAAVFLTAGISARATPDLTPYTPTFIFQQQLPPRSVQEKIVGGEETSPHEFPHIARLIARKKTGGGLSCGATIISENYALTAAHCTDYTLDDYDITIYAGVHSYSNQDAATVQAVKVSKIINHPEYSISRAGIFHDIAVLKLSTPLKWTKYVQAIDLNTDSDCPVTADKCIAAGWGRLRTGQSGPDKPHKVEVPIEDPVSCNRTWSGRTGNGHVCIGSPPPGYKGVCNGDSGGPLYCTCDCKFVQVGVTSFGTRDCAAPNVPMVFSRVSFYKDFIEQSMNDGSDGGTTPPC